MNSSYTSTGNAEEDLTRRRRPECCFSASLFLLERMIRFSVDTIESDEIMSRLIAITGSSLVLLFCEL